MRPPTLGGAPARLGRMGVMSTNGGGIFLHPEMGAHHRLFIFILYTQVVQALMSYDGGATQFCTKALAAAGWTPLWLGFLGAMDKFGQVATAFVWGKVLMRHDAKPLLVVGLFWKASCCFIFGKLQEQPTTWVMQMLMLLAKLGMGITEALISVWATVWVQRNAPHNAKARWLGFAGTSAGIGSGVGSGVASLWSPIYAFFLQAIVLFCILGSLILTPAHYFRFTNPREPSEAGSKDAEDMPTPELLFGTQLLVQEVVRGVAALEHHENIVILESLRFPEHYLDASDEPMDTGFRQFKVRITKADPSDGTWAQFKMVSALVDTCKAGQTVMTFESVRLPGHFLDCSGEPLGWRDNRVKVRLTEPLENEDTATQPWARFLVRTIDGERGLFHLESEGSPEHFLTATGEKMKWGTRACMAKEDLDKQDAAIFRITAVTGNYDGPVPVMFATEGSSLEQLRHLLGNHLWLFTAMAISLNCFVTSGVAFLWQNTVENVWDFGHTWSFLLFISSTGIGGLVGVIVGPKIFDQTLGGFVFPQGKAMCLRTAQYMTFLAAVCSTITVVLLVCKSAQLVYSNQQSVVYWELAVLFATIFLLFLFVNSITGMLYGINIDSVNEEDRTFAAGLTVSFQNVFGFAFGPLLSSAVSELVGDAVQQYWPEWPWRPVAVDGAKYAAGMSSALALTWLLFFFTRKAAVSARLAHISVRNIRSGRSGRLGTNDMYEPLSPSY